MTALSAGNERIKRRYLRYLAEARGLAPSTIDHTARAISNYDEFNGRRDFKQFSSKTATDYKRYLRARGGRRAAQSSRATVVTTARHVQQFFRWLAEQPGFRSIRHSDIEFFNVTRREARLFTDRSQKLAPSLEQVQHVIRSMPGDSDEEKRDRALVACALLTGARVKALITLKLKHLRSDRLGIDQDAREVETKFAKTQPTTFFRVGDDIERIFLDYIDYLRLELLRGPNDPLFPRGQQTLGKDLRFKIGGLSRHHWKTTDPVRRIFRRAFARAGVPYFTPHTIRNCLAAWGQSICRTAEDFKILSQNLGHDDPLVTATSYAHVPFSRQAQRIRELGIPGDDPAVAELRRLLSRCGLGGLGEPGSVQPGTSKDWRTTS